MNKQYCRSFTVLVLGVSFWASAQNPWLLEQQVDTPSKPIENKPLQRSAPNYFSKRDPRVLCRVNKFKSPEKKSTEEDPVGFSTFLSDYYKNFNIDIFAAKKFPKGAVQFKTSNFYSNLKFFGKTVTLYKRSDEPGKKMVNPDLSLGQIVISDPDWYGYGFYDLYFTLPDEKMLFANYDGLNGRDEFNSKKDDLTEISEIDPKKDRDVYAFEPHIMRTWKNINICHEDVIMEKESFCSPRWIQNYKKYAYDKSTYDKSTLGLCYQHCLKMIPGSTNQKICLEKYYADVSWSKDVFGTNPGEVFFNKIQTSYEGYVNKLKESKDYKKLNNELDKKRFLWKAQKDFIKTYYNSKKFDYFVPAENWAEDAISCMVVFNGNERLCLRESTHRFFFVD